MGCDAWRIERFAWPGTDPCLALGWSAGGSWRALGRVWLSPWSRSGEFQRPHGAHGSSLASQTWMNTDSWAWQEATHTYLKLKACRIHQAIAEQGVYRGGGQAVYLWFREKSSHNASLDWMPHAYAKAMYACAYLFILRSLLSWHLTIGVKTKNVQKTSYICQSRQGWGQRSQSCWRCRQPHVY